MSLSDLLEREIDIRHSYGDQVFSSILRLARLTKLIEFIGAGAFGVLLIQMILVALWLLSKSGIRLIYPSNDWISLSSFVFLFSVGLLFLYERIKRSADTIFNEVSDELQWNLNFGDVKHAPDFPERPQLL